MNSDSNNNSFYFIIKPIQIWQNNTIILGFAYVDDNNNIDNKYNRVAYSLYNKKLYKYDSNHNRTVYDK